MRMQLIVIVTDIAWSVCLSVDHISELYKNSWTSQDVSWGLNLFGPNTHTHTQPFNGLFSGTTRVGWYQKKHSPIHTHPDHRTSFITFLHLQRSMASSLFSLRAWQSSQTTSVQVLFGLPLGLGLNFILHAFLHPIIIIFSQHMPIPTQPVLLQYQCCVIYT